MSTEKSSSLPKIAVGFALLAILVSSASLAFTFVGQQAAPETVATREFIVLAVEFKGTAGEDEFIPAGTQASAYGFDPALFIVNKGDKVVLKIYGINGKDHPTLIDGHKMNYKIYKLDVKDGKIVVHQTKIVEPAVKEEKNVSEFNIWRGHLTVVEFVADKPGQFKIWCTTHTASMAGWLIVNPS